MKSTNIILNTKTWDIAIGDSSILGKDDVIILTHEEIMADLPELLRHSAVADAVKNTVLRGIKNFTTVDLPMIGTGRITITVDNASLTTMDSVKQTLLSNIRIEKLFDTRITSCLSAAGIQFVHQIFLYETEDMIRFRNFGKDSLKKVMEYLQRSQINAEIIEKIKRRYAELANVEIGTIPEVAENESFLFLKKEVASLEDIGPISIEAWTGGNGKQNYYRSSFLGERFPYRGQGVNNFTKTKYEEKYNKIQLENLVSQIDHLVLAFQQNEMKKFIEAM